MSYSEYEQFKLKEKEMKNLCISGSYGTMAFKLKRWQQKLDKIACEYMVPYRIWLCSKSERASDWCSIPNENFFLAISRREQVTLKWDDDVRFVLDQHF